MPQNEFNERLYVEIKELRNSIAQIFDSSPRIDERLKSIEKAQLEINNKISDLVSGNNESVGRIMVLESHDHDGNNDLVTEKIRKEVSRIRDATIKHDISIGALQLVSKNNDNKMKNIFDYMVKTAWILLLTYIVYRLGWAGGQPLIP